MKQYRILKAFNGSQHGNDFQAFTTGTTEPLSDALAAIAVKEGWAELAEQAGTPQPVKKAVPLLARMPAEEDDVKAFPADLPTDPFADRETKVVTPEETKPVKKPVAKKGK